MGLLASPARGALALVAASVALCLALCWWQGESVMVWGEETMVHSMPAPVVLGATPDAEGRPRREPSCKEPDAPWLVLSDSRPRLTMCAGGRSWPVMVAPYFAGFFYWPFALFSSLHHDNVLVLRKLGLVFALASILLTYRVVSRFAGRRVAALGALSTAVAPCFILLHSALVHFETLPWIFLMLALLVFSACPGLAPPRRTSPGEDAGATRAGEIPTRLLVLGSFLVGCAIIANLKTVILIAPILLVALRLRVPAARIGARRFALMGLTLLVPLIPAIALGFAPSGGYGDKSDGWQRTLLAHILEPQRIVPTTRDLVLLWSNVPVYLHPITGTSRLNYASAALASAALIFVLVDAARTLVRREGCAVTAALGACIVSYAGMVMLLYESFPANFTPLHTVYSLSIAVALARLGERLAPTGERAWRLAPIALAALLPFAWDTVDTIRAVTETRLPTNTRTELAVVAYLVAQAEPSTVHLTVDSQLAGVVDSLSDGRVRTTQAESFLRSCNPYRDNPEAEGCVTGRWKKLLPSLGSGAVRVIMPADFAAWGSRHIDMSLPLQRGADEAGYSLSLERSFPAGQGAPGIVVYRATPRSLSAN